MKKYIYTTIVKRVIDGDTLILDIDLGFSIVLKNQRCRLARIDAPEKTTNEGKTSLEFLKQLGNKEVLIESLKIDKYGRPLVEIYFNNQNFNDLLVKENFATIYTKQK